MTLHNSEIQLTHLRFYAHHGVLPQERIVGGHFIVTLSLRVALDETALLHDELSGTVSYAEVYAVVQREMSRPSQLLEHVAARILRAVFEAFSRVESATIEVAKEAPPIPSFDGDDCRVRLTAAR
ncbi:MAG: dihydroneopterin aldolase [Bacteroidales bacterium]|nr:dihydroneopterin aldolase [Bacteroidales bacterium]